MSTQGHEGLSHLIDPPSTGQAGFVPPLAPLSLVINIPPLQWKFVQGGTFMTCHGMLDQHQRPAGREAIAASSLTIVPATGSDSRVSLDLPATS